MMMKHLGFSYTEIKGLSRRERTMFFKVFNEEQQKEKEMIDNARNLSK